MTTFRIIAQGGKAVPYAAELGDEDGSGDYMEVWASTSQGVCVDIRGHGYKLVFVRSADHALALGQQLIAAAQALQAAQSGDAA